MAGASKLFILVSPNDVDDLGPNLSLGSRRVTALRMDVCDGDASTPKKGDISVLCTTFTHEFFK